jgi:hypothetical protein
MRRSSAAWSERAVFLGTGPAPLAWTRTPVLLSIGCASLAAGVLLYLTDRATSHALLIPAVASLSGWHLFGPIGQWLPSLVHALSFSLFSAALLTPQPRWEYSACAFWFGVNATFEIGQHPQVRGPLVDALRGGLGQGPVASAFQNYFLRGTFDAGDLVAAGLGAALAAGILRRLRIHQERLHAR